MGKGAIPVDVAAAGDRILIADSGLFEIFAVPQDTYAPAVFGDAAFQRELTSARDTLWRFNTVRTWAGRGIWLLALGTILLVVFIVVKNYGKREQPAALSRAAARKTARRRPAGRGDFRDRKNNTVWNSPAQGRNISGYGSSMSF